MSIAQTLTTSFKQQLLKAVHDFDTDTFYMALYTANADIGAATTVYTAAGEISGTGYTALGQVMTGISVSVKDTTAKYKEAMGQLKRLGDGLERQDAYRSGQARVPVP